MRRHLALFTALALASADTEGELRLSLTYNDMADSDSAGHATEARAFSSFGVVAVFGEL